MTVESEFLQFSADKLLQLMQRIETCVASLSAEQVWQRHSENENAIGNLLLHLNGNLKQWILSGVDGAADQRNRDAEFAARSSSSSNENDIERDPKVLVARLGETVDAVAQVLRTLPEARLLDSTETQGYKGTVLTAIYHVVEHFAGHTFQIIFITKRLTGGDLGFYAHLNKQAAAGDLIP